MTNSSKNLTRSYFLCYHAIVARRNNKQRLIRNDFHALVTSFVKTSAGRVFFFVMIRNKAGLKHEQASL